MFDDAVEEIRQAIDSMPPQQQKVGRYLCNHPDAIGVLSLTDIAGKIGASGPTVNRFCHSLGYSGFLEFSRTMQGLRSRRISHAAFFHNSLTRYLRGGEDGALGRFMLAADAANAHKLLENYPAEQLKQCTELLLNASSIAVIGKMGAYPAAVYFEQLLIKVTGKLAAMSGDDVMQAAALSRLDSRSAVFALAFPRYSRAAVELAREASQRGAAVIAITDSEFSPLAEFCNLLFTVKVELFSCIELSSALFSLINCICLEYSLAQGIESEKSLGRYDKAAESAFFLQEKKQQRDSGKERPCGGNAASVDMDE